MLELLRRQMGWLMIVVAVLLLIGFILWDSTSNPSGGGNPDVALSLFGKSYRHSDVNEIAKGYSVARFLGLEQMAMVLSRADQRFALPENGGVPNDFIINSIILREEAPKHGIGVTDAEVEEAIQTLPILQNNGQFDPSRFRMLTDNLKQQQGITIPDIYATVRDSVLLDKALRLVGAGIRPSATEASKLYEHLFSTIEGTAFTLKRADHEKVAEPTEEEIKAYYEENKVTLLTKERRRVDYVYFGEPEALDQLPTEERLTAMKDYNRKLQDYSNAVVAENADFDAITREQGYKFESTELFAASAPPEVFRDKGQILGAIFDERRTVDDPVSDPITVEGGAYIFRLAEVAGAEPMELEAARAEIIEAVKASKVVQALADAADKAREAVEAAAKAGTDPIAAATGATALPVTGLQIATPPVDLSEGQLIAGLASDLQAGGVSQRAPTADGMLFFYCKERKLTEDPDKQTRMNSLTDRIASRDNLLAFNAWFQTLKDAAGLEH